MSDFGQNLIRFAQNVTNLGISKDQFQLGEPKCAETDIKIPDLPQIWPYSDITISTQIVPLKIPELSYSFVFFKFILCFDLKKSEIFLI